MTRPRSYPGPRGRGTAGAPLTRNDTNVRLLLFLRQRSYVSCCCPSAAGRRIDSAWPPGPLPVRHIGLTGNATTPIAAGAVASGGRAHDHAGFWLPGQPQPGGIMKQPPPRGERACATVRRQLAAGASGVSVTDGRPARRAANGWSGQRGRPRSAAAGGGCRAAHGGSPAPSRRGRRARRPVAGLPLVNAGSARTDTGVKLLEMHDNDRSGPTQSVVRRLAALPLISGCRAVRGRPRRWPRGLAAPTRTAVTVGWCDDQDRDLPRGSAAADPRHRIFRDEIPAGRRHRRLRRRARRAEPPPRPGR